MSLPGIEEKLLGELERILESGLKRLDSRREPQPIRELHLELTHRCNLRCVMCHHWEMPFRDPASVGREMDFEKIRRFVSRSRLLRDVQIVVITGGEPWIKKDIVEIVQFLSEHYPRASIGILTNFWNTQMARWKLSQIREAGVRNLWLGSSLDGLERTHDEIRGRRGAFNGLMETVSMLRREFPDIQFSFSFTITPKNYRDLWPAYLLVRDMGLWFGAQMVVNHEGLEAPERFSWKEEQLRDVERQIDLILSDVIRSEGAIPKLAAGRDDEFGWLWSRLLYWRYLRKYAAGPERFPIMKDCMAGQRYAMFDPEGNLFYCPVNKHRHIGNVNEKPFDRIWTSAQAEAEREYVDSCRCHCWLNCIANPVLDRLLKLGTENAEPACH